MRKRRPPEADDNFESSARPPSGVRRTFEIVSAILDQTGDPPCQLEFGFRQDYALRVREILESGGFNYRSHHCRSLYSCWVQVRMKKRPGMRISLIVAMSQNRVIGRGGSIPWKIPGEQKLFKRITLGHSLIMGRKTHEDIGRPLPERLNIVVSRRKDYRPSGCLVADSLQVAFGLCPSDETEAFIIGGGQLYREALPMADRIYLTLIPAAVPGDTFFPEFSEEFTLTACEHFTGPQPYALHIYDRMRAGPE